MLSKKNFDSSLTLTGEFPWKISGRDDHSPFGGHFAIKNQNHEKTKMKNMKAISALGAWKCRTVMKSLFAVLALMLASSAPLIAGDLEPGRYAIESAAHAKKFLRGLPEQGNKVVTAENPMATVLLVKAEDGDAYSLQSHAFFLSVEGAHDVVMHKANGARERFKITKNPDGTFSLKAVWCGKYITVDKDGNVDSSKEPGDNAKFKLHKK